MSGGFDDGTFSVDPMATLATAFVEGLGKVSADFTQAYIFLHLYAPGLIGTVARPALAMKIRQTPGSGRQIQGLASALAREKETAIQKGVAKA